jgi:hypothetical protein
VGRIQPAMVRCGWYAGKISMVERRLPAQVAAIKADLGGDLSAIESQLVENFVAPSETWASPKSPDAGQPPRPCKFMLEGILIAPWRSRLHSAVQ